MRHSKSHYQQLLQLMSFRDVPSHWEPVTGVMKYDKWGKGRFIRHPKVQERMAQVCAIRHSAMLWVQAEAQRLLEKELMSNA
jgi:hypothetical protein